MADVASLIFDIDSSQAEGAAKALAGLNRYAAATATATAKLEKSVRGADGRFKSFVDHVADSEQEVRKLAASYNPVLNAQLRFAEAQKEVARAVQLGVISSSQQAEVLRRLQSEYSKSASVANNFARTQGQGAMQSANVFAQLNDIGVMLAAGQNPFQLAIQQGTQLNQVWASMGAQGRTLGGVAGMLRGAISTMISPMNLLTIGTIAGTAAFVQWVTSTDDASKKAQTLEERLGGLAGAADAYSQALGRAREPMFALVKDFGTQAQEAERILDLLARIQKAEFFQQTSTLMEGLGKHFEDLTWYVDRYNEVLSQGEKKGPALERPIAGLRKQYGLAIEDAILLNGVIDGMGNSPGPLEAARALETISEILVTAQENGGKVPPELIRMATEATTAALRVQALTGELNNAANAAQGIVIPLGMTYGSGAWASGLGGEDLLPPARVPKKKNTGAAELKQAEKQFQSLRELLEKDSQFQVAEYEKRQKQLQNALNRKLLSEQKYNEMRAQLQLYYFGLDYQKNELNYTMDLEQLNALHAAKLLSEEQFLMQRAALQHKYYSEAIGVEQNSTSQTLSQLSDHFSQMNSLAGGGYDGLLKAQKAFAAGSALINAYLAASQALADPTVPFWAKFAAYAKVLAAGLGAVNAIKGGGKGGGGASAATSAASGAPAQPNRYVYVELDGPDWMVDMAENIMDQIYQASSDGRVIVSRV